MHPGRLPEGDIQTYGPPSCAESRRRNMSAPALGGTAHGLSADPEVLLAIMAGPSSSGRPKHACLSSAIRCLIFEAPNDRPSLFGAPAVMPRTSSHAVRVPPSAYLRLQPPLPTPPGPMQCCNTFYAGRPSLANGSSSFFCRPHTKVTLAAQYRFLPALAHAARLVAASPGLRWLVLVDDASKVDAGRLLVVLRSLAERHDARGHGLYLGDFGPSTHGQWTGRTQFACGGGGTVFDRKAALTLEFVACARRYHGACAQSDWMIGECARLGGVPPMGGGKLAWTSCGVCIQTCSSKYLARVLTSLERGCAFAQQSPWTVCSQSSAGFGEAACTSNASSSFAIRHDWCNCGDLKCAQKKRLYNAPSEE